MTTKIAQANLLFGLILLSSVLFYKLTSTN